MAKILTAHQPVYLPWLGLFHKIAISDTYVYLDSIQFEKNSFLNRNKIKLAQGSVWLTVPVLLKDHFKKTIKEIEKKFKGKGYESFKKSLSDLLINSLEPFRRKKKELLTREVYVKEILNQGVKRAQVLAQSTIQEVRKKMGLI